MAGSIRNFSYDTDDGDSFALRGDESNLEAVNGQEANVPPIGNRPIYYLPRSFTPRFAVYVTSDGLRSLRIPVLTAATFATIGTQVPTVSSGGTTYDFIYKRAERNRGIRWADSGITDGDSETA